MSDAASNDTFAEMAKLAAEHALLKPIEGTFRAEVRLWMGPGDPLVTTGTMVNRFELGDRFLYQVYTGDANDGPFPSFEGRGYFGFNTTTRRFEGMWVDNASTMMQVEQGTVDESGKLWTMHSEMPMPGSGQPVKKRSIIRVVDADHHEMEAFFTGEDGQEVRNMQILYTRTE